jgi:hypothetical protein
MNLHSLARIALCAVLWLPSGVHAEAWVSYDLGDASFAVPEGWEVTSRRRGSEYDFQSPDGETTLMAFWWFPDEPLLGFDDIVDHEEQTLPGGRALLIHSLIGQRETRQAAFEATNEDGERFLLLLEAPQGRAAELQTQFEQIIKQVRFAGIAPAALPAPPDLPDETPRYFDAVGGFSVRLPQGWAGYAADLPGVRQVVLVPDRNGALVIVALAAGATAMDDYETLLYSDYVIPRQIEAEHDTPIGQVAGRTLEITATVYSIAGVRLPFDRARVHKFRGQLPDGRAVLLARVVPDSASEALVSSAAEVMGSFALGQTADGSVQTTAVEVDGAPQRPAGNQASAIAPAEAATTATAVVFATRAGSARVFSGRDDAGWTSYQGYGGSFEEFAHYEGDKLAITVPEGHSWGATGLYSATPVIAMPGRDATQAERLIFDVDPRRSSHAVFSLVSAKGVGSHDAHVNDIRVAFEQNPDVGPEMVLWISRQEAGRVGLNTDEATGKFSLTLHPDGVAMVHDKDGRLLLEAATPELAPEEGWHLYVGTQAFHKNLPATLVLNTINKEIFPVPRRGKPAAFLDDQPQTTVLFDSRMIGPGWTRYDTRGNYFVNTARVDPIGLVVDVPEKKDVARVGLYSIEPLIWLDRFTEGASARLRIEFDAAQTTGFAIGLAGRMGLNGNEPSNPRFLLEWYEQAEGGIVARRLFDHKDQLLELHPEAMPQSIELVLSPDGLRLLAEGFPDEVLEWGALQDGQGFRLYVYSRPEAPGLPVKMTVRRIVLTRTPGDLERLSNVAAPGVEPLPQTQLFAGAPSETFEPFGLHGAEFEPYAHYENGALVVDLPKKFMWSVAGLLSTEPVIRMDERVATTPYRVRLKFDPSGTENFHVMFSPHKVTDMYKSRKLQATLVRKTEGRDKGHYVLTLGHDYYDYWSRYIDADWLAEHWDGDLTLLIGEGWVELSLSDDIRLRGSTFAINRWSALYMTVSTVSAKTSGPAFMALKEITTGWVTPPGMDAQTRMNLVDDVEFDPDAFLDLIGDDLTEDLP